MLASAHLCDDIFELQRPCFNILTLSHSFNTSTSAVVQFLTLPTTVHHCPASQVHGECVTIKTRFRPVPLRWVFCHKAPRQGAVLEELMAKQQQQQQSGGGGGVGRLNPRLRMDDWVEEEVK
jgi:hypothetical protein